MATLTSDSRTGQIGPSGAPRVTLRLFASARQAAGTGHADLSGATVGAVLAEAIGRWGEPFAAVLDRSRVWVNGEPADRAQAVRAGDEVAVLPPVSGGAA